jgi:hypothetical protein
MHSCLILLALLELEWSPLRVLHGFSFWLRCIELFLKVKSSMS